MLAKIGLLVLAFVVVVPTIFAYRAYAESAPATIGQFKQTCFDSVFKVVVVFVIFLGIEQGMRTAVRQGIVGLFSSFFVDAFFLFYAIVSILLLLTLLICLGGGGRRLLQRSVHGLGRS